MIEGQWGTGQGLTDGKQFTAISRNKNKANKGKKRCSISLTSRLTSEVLTFGRYDCAGRHMDTKDENVWRRTIQRSKWAKLSLFLGLIKF